MKKLFFYALCVTLLFCLVIGCTKNTLQNSATSSTSGEADVPIDDNLRHRILNSSLPIFTNPAEVKLNDEFTMGDFELLMTMSELKKKELDANKVSLVLLRDKKTHKLSISVLPIKNQIKKSKGRQSKSIHTKRCKTYRCIKKGTRLCEEAGGVTIVESCALCMSCIIDDETMSTLNERDGNIASEDDFPFKSVSESGLDINVLAQLQKRLQNK